MSHPRTRSMFAKAKASVTGSPADILDAILADQVAVARARAEHPEPDGKPAIITDFIYPPIPVRDHDWRAYRDSHEEDGNYGYGETKEAAIANLLALEADGFGPDFRDLELDGEDDEGDDEVVAPDDYPVTERQRITANRFEEYETDRMWGREDE